ncbi:hypothetical protein SPI_04828 [Niveomyces insectorum RCEF 264]|uniref:Uncharacterized protein n=1 Tax=Niveomyces insectorum RCEF 264 TaxID=1081102 RepID=A0A167UW79_9HYPO|nr:hypothetical protein SPI_04828 [Niveomyces insectorum RCEF 264]
MASATAFGQASTSARTPFAPSVDVAAQRGPQIFNSLFDSLRRWGATVHPNGMSFALATVPEGVLLHHGNGRNATPTTLDWLAYEIEHAEIFAKYRMGHPYRAGRSSSGESTNALIGVEDVAAQAPLGGYESVDNDDDDDDNAASSDETGHGWLHTFRTTRPLQFLYIDGMSGNKGNSGVIDTQDYILRATSTSASQPVGPPNHEPDPRPPGPPGEYARALDLCALCAEWQLHGVIRTESAGTEIIKCNFSDGLEQIQSLRRADPDAHPHPGGADRGGFPSRRHSRADAFRDVGAGRTRLDDSSWVSAFVFPVNLTNPDAQEPTLPRLVSTSADERIAIRTYLMDVVNERRGAAAASVSWRDVADLVVRRYADSMAFLAFNATTRSDFVDRTRFLLDVFVDYSVADAAERDAAAEARCATFYMQGKQLDTESDHLLYAAFKAVTAEICATLFGVRRLVTKDTGHDDDASWRNGKASLVQLVDYLGWSVFK